MFRTCVRKHLAVSAIARSENALNFFKINHSTMENSLYGPPPKSVWKIPGFQMLPIIGSRHGLFFDSGKYFLIWRLNFLLNYEWLFYIKIYEIKDKNLFSLLPTSSRFVKNYLKFKNGQFFQMFSTLENINTTKLLLLTEMELVGKWFSLLNYSEIHEMDLTMRGINVAESIILNILY